MNEKSLLNLMKCTLGFVNLMVDQFEKGKISCDEFLNNTSIKVGFLENYKSEITNENMRRELELAFYKYHRIIRKNGIGRSF